MNTIDFARKRYEKLNAELQRELNRAAQMTPGKKRDALLEHLEELANKERDALGEMIGVNAFLRECEAEYDNRSSNNEPQ